VASLPLLAPPVDAPTWSWLIVALLGACAVALWVVVARLAEIERRLAGKPRPDEAADALSRSAGARENIDLRRIEQILGELRDGSRRLEDALLRAVSATRAGGANLEVAGAASVDLGERVTNRMLALGFERVVIVTPREQFESILNSGGEVSVEARRDGAACKGKAIFRGGALVDVAMQSAYATFP